MRSLGKLSLRDLEYVMGLRKDGGVLIQVLVQVVVINYLSWFSFYIYMYSNLLKYILFLLVYQRCEVI